MATHKPGKVFLIMFSPDIERDLAKTRAKALLVSFVRRCSQEVYDDVMHSDIAWRVRDSFQYVDTPGELVVRYHLQGRSEHYSIIICPEDIPFDEILQDFPEVTYVEMLNYHYENGHLIDCLVCPEGAPIELFDIVAMENAKRSPA